MFRSNLNANAFALKTLILVGGAVDDAVRAELEARLHARTWVHYGLSDVPGAALAFECEERSGLHVSEDHFLAEVVDPATGAVLPEGEEGELVLTTLSSRAVPLIRFRTGDRVRFVPGECACGRTLRRLAWSKERTDEAMVIRGVIVYPQQIHYLLEKTLGFVPEATRFQVRARDERECLEAWLQVDEKIFSDEIKEMERLSQKIGMELYQELGISVKVRFKEKGSFGADA
jgi:phenylacetate-CoA ligase